MAPRLSAVTLDAHDPRRLASFWGALLGRDPVDDARGTWLPGTDTQVGLRFAPTTTATTAREALHLHLTSTTAADQLDRVATVIDLGGSHLDVGQLADEGHVVLADPEGNAFCVIEAGNSFLAGCGPLGEVACDGSREVGVFWAAALDWPLVWDQDDETAVQSPEGGTKVAWGGAFEAPASGRDRQRLDLVTGGDLAAEGARLVALGATQLGSGTDDVIRLADPGGHEFSLTRGTA